MEKGQVAKIIFKDKTIEEKITKVSGDTFKTKNFNFVREKNKFVCSNNNEVLGCSILMGVKTEIETEPKKTLWDKITNLFK